MTNLAKSLARRQHHKIGHAEAIPVPAGLNADEAEIYRRTIRAAGASRIEFAETMAELVARSPDLSSRLETISRDKGVNMMAHVIATTPVAKALGPDFFEKLSSLPLDEMAVILSSAQLRTQTGFSPSQDEIKKAFELSDVVEVMEDESVEQFGMAKQWDGPAEDMAVAMYDQKVDAGSPFTSLA